MRLRIWLVLLLASLWMVFPTFAQSSDITTELTALEALDFDSFLDESYYVLLRRNPELVIELSLQDDIGLEGVTLNDVSDAYAEETAFVVAEILSQLHDYDREALSLAQQVSYDVYEWYLDDMVRGYEFRLYEFPVTFFITSENSQTASFFTDIHPLETVQDAEDYITRLNLVDDKFEQTIATLEPRAEAGIIPPRMMLQWTMGGLNYFSSGSAENHDFYTTFRQGISEIEELSETEWDELSANAAIAIEESVIPGYASLADAVTALMSQAPTTSGSWQYPGGDEYYTYALRHFTTTDLTADEIHEMGLTELERIHAEMRLLFDELGYDSTESIASLYAQLGRDEETISASQVVSTFEDLIDEAYPAIEGVFSHIPEAEIVVIGGDRGGYYIPGALDGSRPGAFYASVENRPYFNMPSLLYHEALPGHHLQIAWAQEFDLPAFRRGASFTSYVEGWALYAEGLAYDLGWYDDDPVGNLGRLQYEAFRATRLVVDTGLHTKEWTFNESVTFFAENTGFNNDMAQGQIARYTVWPGQSTSYMIGMLEILGQRERMQAAFGDEFNYADFHDVILNNGSVPLAILDEIVTDVIAGQ